MAAIVAYSDGSQGYCHTINTATDGHHVYFYTVPYLHAQQAIQHHLIVWDAILTPVFSLFLVPLHSKIPKHHHYKHKGRVPT